MEKAKLIENWTEKKLRCSSCFSDKNTKYSFNGKNFCDKHIVKVMERYELSKKEKCQAEKMTVNLKEIKDEDLLDFYTVLCIASKKMSFSNNLIERKEEIKKEILLRMNISQSNKTL